MPETNVARLLVSMRHRLPRTNVARLQTSCDRRGLRQGILLELRGRTHALAQGVIEDVWTFVDPVLHIQVGDAADT